MQNVLLYIKEWIKNDIKIVLLRNRKCSIPNHAHMNQKWYKKLVFLYKVFVPFRKLVDFSYWSLLSAGKVAITSI